jgi:chaperonin GroES
MRLTGDKILVRPTKKANQTESGLFLPDTLSGDQEVSGTVVAVGSGPVTAKGVLLDHYVEVGDVILFSPYVGQETDAFGERMFIMKESEVLAVVEEGDVQ